MTVIRFTKREQFIEALEARRPWAQAYDKRVTAKHKADEKAALDGFRAKCRELAKLSYDELKRREAESYHSVRASFDAPSCPTSKEAMLDDTLAVLNLSHQEAYTVDSNGHWRSAYWLLTHDENARKDVC